MSTEINKGDYVLATKYTDGAPTDHFAVGYFDSMTWHGRYNIIDGEGKLFRHNGFRKVQKISGEIGAKILSHIKDIEASGVSLWDWLAKFEKP